MDNIFLVSGIISFIYFIAKFMEMRYVDKETKPFKIIFRDVLFVYVSVVIGFFIVEQLKPVVEETIHSTSIPLAFTDNPPF